jgi:hypothetical protein
MNDVLTRAACDFEDDTCRRQNIAKDIENEIAIPYCRRCVLAVIGHLPHTFKLGFGPAHATRFRCRGFWQFGSTRLRHSIIVAPLSQPRDLSGRDESAFADRLGLALQ